MKTIEMNGLHFNLTSYGYVCQELKDLPAHFAKRWSEKEIVSAIADHLRVIINSFRMKDKDLSETEERDTREKEFEGIIGDENLPAMPLFDRFMYVLGDWWYYSPRVGTQFRSHSWDDIHEHTVELARQYLLPVLPMPVQAKIENMKIANIAVGFGHFAILAIDQQNEIRRIVTDTQLFELHDVHGYCYLDILPNGKPVARSVTSRGGERAFFDGVRLMSHNRFETCAPKTVVLPDGGYKVNSTQCTIINGLLYPLIDEGDTVAHSTGSFLGCNPWNRKDQLESLTLAEESARKLREAGGVITIGDKEYHPIGEFAPSEVTLLNSGFALYEWSEFLSTFSPKYQSVMVVDDNREWLKEMENAFTNKIQTFETYQTRSKRKALDKVLEMQPEALVLDMHLTKDEQFDGLWIANQLFERGYAGQIIIASSYGDDALRAMAKLIKGNVMIPGKNIGRIRQCLSHN